MKVWTGSGYARRGIMISLAAAALYGLLLIPEAAPPAPEQATGRPFRWNQNERWLALEQRFKEAHALGCEQLREPFWGDVVVTRGKAALDVVLARCACDP